MIDYKALGKRVRDIRISKKLTQKDIADKVRISFRYYSDIETGRGKSSIQTIVDIVNELDTSLDKVFCDSLKNISNNDLVDSKLVYDREVKEILDDLNQDELKIIIDMIITNKKAIRKSAEIERYKFNKKE